jgi:APA family basic amino acid/polyamine antiporter
VVLVKVLSPPTDSLAWAAVFSSCIIAFFAFVGFEDIVNMAEEIVEPKRVLPRAIIYTLMITMLLYVLIASIAIALPDREALTSSNAPMAVLFESVTGSSGKPIAAMAAIAMINGILVQVVMASRVLYGMAREGLAPVFLSVIDAKRRTPARAIFLVTASIAVLALTLPLVSLAQATSLVTLCVFSLVNLALWRIGSRENSDPDLQRWRYWGIFAAVLSTGLLAIEVIRFMP